MHILVLIPEIGVGLHHNIRYDLSDRARIYYKGVFCITSNILKLAASEEYDNGINRYARILRQTLSDSLNVSGNLHYGVVKAVLFFAVCQ